MTTKLYLEYKRDTGKEPILALEAGTIWDTELFKAKDLEQVVTTENDEEFYTCAYIEWLEDKLENCIC